MVFSLRSCYKDGDISFRRKMTFGVMFSNGPVGAIDPGFATISKTIETLSFPVDFPISNKS